LQIGGQQFVHRREDGELRTWPRLGGAGRVRLDGRDQSNAQAGRSSSR
jgi:hypothetical protein